MTEDVVSLDLPSQARVLGDAPAVIMGDGQVMSYRELDERVEPARPTASL